MKWIWISDYCLHMQKTSEKQIDSKNGKIRRGNQNEMDFCHPIDMPIECDDISIILYLKDMFNQSILPKETM